MRIGAETQSCQQVLPRRLVFDVEYFAYDDIVRAAHEFVRASYTTLHRLGIITDIYSYLTHMTGPLHILTSHVMKLLRGIGSSAS